MKSHIRPIFHPITPAFSIHTEALTLDIALHDKGEFCHQHNEEKVTIYCPRHTQFEAGDFQPWFRDIVRQVLRIQAKRFLTPRVAQWSEVTHLPYKRLFLKNVRTKWGSYSSMGNINLSIYLMVLPLRYIDYTICHELCHSQEMNHGPQFWALLDKYMDGQAKQISREMKDMVKLWYETGDARYLLICNQ